MKFSIDIIGIGVLKLYLVLIFMKYLFGFWFGFLVFVVYYDSGWFGGKELKLLNVFILILFFFK